MVLYYCYCIFFEVLHCSTIPFISYHTTQQGTYSNFIGFDYSHIQDPEQAKWLQDKAEAQFTVSNEEKKNLLQGIVQSVGYVWFGGIACVNKAGVK